VVNLTHHFLFLGFALVMGEMPKESEKLSKPDLEKTEEKHEKTAKLPEAKEPKQPAEPKSATFPVEGTINAYGFIHLNTDLMEAFGVSKGKKTSISIDFKEGALIIKKA